MRVQGYKYETERDQCKKEGETGETSVQRVRWDTPTIEDFRIGHQTGGWWKPEPFLLTA